MINGQEEYRLDYSSNAFSPPMSFLFFYSGIMCSFCFLYIYPEF